MNIKAMLLRPTLAHVLMVSFLLGITTTLLWGIQQALSSAEDSVKRNLVVSVFLQSTVSDDQAKILGDSLRARDPEIQSAVYLSKEAAFQEAQKDPELAKSLMVLKENPLPASFLIHYSDRAWFERVEPAEPLKALPEIQEIRWDPQTRTVFRSLHQWRSWLFRISAFTGMILVVWSFFGLYRFLSVPSTVDLSIHLAVGLLGGTVAVLLWGYALREVGMDASAYRPAWFSWLPLATGLIAGMACFGLERHEP